MKHIASYNQFNCNKNHMYKFFKLHFAIHNILNFLFILLIRIIHTSDFFQSMESIFHKILNINEFRI